MKRNLAIREFIKLLNDDDIIIASGPNICKEAYLYDRPLTFYIEDDSIAQSLALGLANGTSKRVFVLCTDDTIQSDLDFVLQLGISKKENIFCIVFNTKQGARLLGSCRSVISALFNLGADIYDYSNYFSKIANVASVKGHVSVLRGPTLILIGVKDSKVTSDYVETDYKLMADTLNGRDTNKE